MQEPYQKDRDGILLTSWSGVPRASLGKIENSERKEEIWKEEK
jgi:hypothetical protein